MDYNQLLTDRCQQQLDLMKVISKQLPATMEFASNNWTWNGVGDNQTLDTNYNCIYKRSDNDANDNWVLNEF
jgi:hypothetical protein